MIIKRNGCTPIGAHFILLKIPDNGSSLDEKLIKPWRYEESTAALINQTSKPTAPTLKVNDAFYGLVGALSHVFYTDRLIV